MTSLWIAMLAIGGIVAAALARPFLKGAAPVAQRAEYDLNVFRDQLDEVSRDAEQGLLDAQAAEAARLEIQRRMLAADAELQAKRAQPEAPKPKRGAVAVALAVPVCGLLLYLALGSPEMPDEPYAARTDLAAAKGGNATQHQAQGNEIAAMVGRLSERLLKNPEDLDGWLLLGRSYLALERGDDAMNAFERARKLAPGQPDVEVAFAEAVIVSNGMKVNERAERILTEVHTRAPFEPKSRYYLGLKKAQDGDLKGALQDWVDLLALSPTDAPWVPIVRTQVNRAANELNVDPTTVTASAEVRKLVESQGGVPQQSLPAPAASQPGPTEEQMRQAQQMSPEERMAMIRSMVQRLADRLKEQPDDLQGWKRLEQAYRVIGEPEKAAEAARQVERLSSAKPSAPPMAAPGPTQEQMRAAQDMNPDDRMAMIRGMVQRLADRLKAQPDDLQGWQRLERAYRVLGDEAKADEAAAQVKRLSK